MTRSTNSPPFLALFLALLLPAVAFAQFGQPKGKGTGGFDPFAEPAPAPVAPGQEVVVSAAGQHDSVPQGGRTAIAFTFSHAPGYKTWPAAELDLLPPDLAAFAFPTYVGLGSPTELVNGPPYRGDNAPAPEWITAVAPITWPEAADVTNPGSDDPPTVKGFKGDAVAYIAFQIAEDAPVGEHTIPVGFYYQACDDDVCYQPVSGFLDVTLAITASGEPYVAAADTSVFEGYAMPATGWAEFVAPDPAETVAGADGADDVDAADDAEAPAVAGGTIVGLSIPKEGPAALLALIAFGALGGFILNLTPCVLPVIPLKVMTLSKHAGESRGRAIYLGGWMFFGVTAFWAALALPVIFLERFADPSALFGIWWVTLGIGLVVAVLALGLMGLFAINLPQKTYMINPKADNASGSFLYGIMTAILGLPCFGFVAGALVPIASTNGPLFSITLFTSMGVGMAAPYLVFAAYPDLLKFLPKTGPASDLVKQVMGLLLLAAGAYFFVSGINSLLKTYPFLADDAQWTTAAIFGTLAGLWLVYKTFVITKKFPNRAVFSLVGLVISGISVALATNFISKSQANYVERQQAIAEAGTDAAYITTLWNDYSPELLEKLAADGKAAVIDFTADWCVNCKALKAAVLDVDPVRERLRADDVVKVTVDMTAETPEQRDLLTSFGRVGIPTLAVLNPDGELVWVSSSYTSGDVLGALETALSPGS